jgi:gluconate 5-dehydrogenase
MQQPFSLEGRRAIVTGSSRGLGYAIAHALGTAGATVAINSRNADKVDEACVALAADGINAVPLAFDVADGVNAVAAINRFHNEQGGLDIFVHNAGNGVRKAFLEQSKEEWLSVIDTHLIAAFELGQAAGKLMAAAGKGRIIFTTSIMGSVSRASVSSYCTAKGGMNALTRSMATELGPLGITVNGIAPGYIATELTEPLHKDPTFNAYVSRQTPVGRWGEPEEIGWAALYLASDAAAYVNGNILTVDGGMTISLGT